MIKCGNLYSQKNCIHGVYHVKNVNMVMASISLFKIVNINIFSLKRNSLKFYQVGVCNGWGRSNELAHGLFNYFSSIGHH